MRVEAGDAWVWKVCGMWKGVVCAGSGWEGREISAGLCVEDCVHKLDVSLKICEEVLRACSEICDV